MPFCYHCGKEIQADWISCPFCSNSIASNNVVNVASDSAVGEITTVSNTVNNNVTNMTPQNQCPSCYSSGNISIWNCKKPNCQNLICGHCKIEIGAETICSECFKSDSKADFVANPWKFEMMINTWFEQELQAAGIAITEPLRRRISGNVKIGIDGFDHEEFRKSCYVHYSIPYPGPKKRKKPGFFAKLDHALNTPSYLLDKNKKK
ncbi:hypothetical protein N9L27_00900 [Candidatus Poseidoniales archaeon]|nr:hypothetical protein [Candidatus Poseidoniales archaeon]